MRAQPTIEGFARNGVQPFHLEVPTLQPSMDIPAKGTAVETAAALGATETTTVRVEPVRWSVIVAGVFAALSALTMLGLLASALGLTPFFPASLREGGGPELAGSFWTFAVAAIVTMLAFGFGAFIASGLSIVHTLRTGVLCGALVWGVGVPVVAAGVMARHAMVSDTPAYDYRVVEPNVTVPPTAGRGAVVVRPDAIQARAAELALGERIRREGGITFVSLFLALGAAIGGGLLGSIVMLGRRGRRSSLAPTSGTSER